MAFCKTHTSIILIFLLLQVVCYEKTLRKIVRNQSKMVQKPFSDIHSENLVWKNISQQLRAEMQDALDFPGTGYGQPKTIIHKMQRPKISTIISSVDSTRSKFTYAKSKMARPQNMFHNELRLSRNTLNNLTAAMQITDQRYWMEKSTEGTLLPERRPETISNNSYHRDITVDTYYKIPSKSIFFPPNDEQNLQNVDQKPPSSNENIIVIPENREFSRDNGSLLVKGIYIANSDLNVKSTSINQGNSQRETIADSEDQIDFLIKEANVPSLYNFNVTATPYTCTDLKESKADIDAQSMFAGFEIEPHWMVKKHFWNHIFDSRYESLMRNQKWPPLKVILIPRTHVDTTWKRTFESYHNDTVKVILSNIVKKLQFYKNLTFSWNEVSHLSHWWKTTPPKNRSAFRRLVKNGRIEITTGGWVEPDEATTHIFGLIHQLIEGHQWLKCHLNYAPKVAWLTNSVTHSPTVAYLLSVTGISNMVLTNLHFSWEEFLAEYQYSDFIWLQRWNNDKSVPTPLNEDLMKIGKDRYPNHSVLTHYLQFNSAGFKACGPNKAICITDFNFAKSKKNFDVYAYNVKDKAELLLEQYSKTGTITPHNVIIAPIGGPYHYELQAEFDYQYNNYQKLADFINVNRDIYKATVEFGTAKDYFDTIVQRRKTYPTLKGDFLNFADINTGSPAYWTGFFTSRPLFKILLRRLQSTLRTTELLFTFAVSFNVFREFNSSQICELLTLARETVARLLDRNVVSGTLNANALRYAHTQILTTVKNCWYIQEVAVSLLSIKPGLNTRYVHKYVYRDGEFISVYRTVSPGDQIYIFNSLSHERTEIVELMVTNPNIRIVDHNKKEVTIQINPVWKYNSDNLIKISRRFFKIIFAIVVPPLTLQLYKIKHTYDRSHSAATVYCVMCVVDELAPFGQIFPFNLQPIETGDIQLESYKHRLIFDEITGFLKTVVEKESNFEKHVVIDYGAFRSSSVNSGMFLFNTNVSKPLQDVLMAYRTGSKSKIVIITSGQLTTELTVIYGRFLQNTIKIHNLLHSPLSNVIHIESKVDYEASPNNRELELFLSIQTDIGNGNPPRIFTDNNGFQYTARTLNMTRRIESNIYPMTSMAYIQDQKSRLTFITDHAQGVTALQEGQLIIMLDRRVLFNDGRGSDEGLADSSATCHRQYILLENFSELPSHFKPSSDQQLPSLSAINLANSLNYFLDVFLIDKNETALCHYRFLPLIKTAFPCDVDLINYRVILNEVSHRHIHSAALMILHRQAISCHIHLAALNCNGDPDFSLDKILLNVKAIYQTNLAGTNDGIPLFNLNKVNFPAMELMTLRIHF